MSRYCGFSLNCIAVYCMSNKALSFWYRLDTCIFIFIYSDVCLFVLICKACYAVLSRFDCELEGYFIYGWIEMHSSTAPWKHDIPSYERKAKAPHIGELNHEDEHFPKTCSFKIFHYRIGHYMKIILERLWIM
ncbi:hypothetical protein CFP56_019120 [Quercus suber]|uniref:Uncharacterized protein n=1 Tax=Quercus suber TaxID=58331 RepID=A0AAW0M0K1_QUESU